MTMEKYYAYSIMKLPHKYIYVYTVLGIHKRNMPRVAFFAYGGSCLCRLGSGELWCMAVLVHGRWLEVCLCVEWSMHACMLVCN